MLNTLGNNRFVHKGSQWALHNATVVGACLDLFLETWKAFQHPF